MGVKFDFGVWSVCGSMIFVFRSLKLIVIVKGDFVVSLQGK